MIRKINVLGIILGFMMACGICSGVEIRYDDGTPKYIKPYDPM